MQICIHIHMYVHKKYVSILSIYIYIQVWSCISIYRGICNACCIAQDLDLLLEAPGYGDSRHNVGSKPAVAPETGIYLSITRRLLGSL